MLERHKGIVLLIFSLFCVILALFLCELLLRKFMGLGNPIMYDSSPIYGYRPLAEREYTRFGGARVKFNNLGLRTDYYWDKNKGNKILFLGDSVTYGGSYIGNRELFSHLTGEFLEESGLPGYLCGNAAVNAWGVENIAAFIHEYRFLPAATYVTIVPEDDFYRGLTRIQGQPVFNREPRWALRELWYFFCYKQNNKRYSHWSGFADDSTKVLVVEKAVKNLREMDDFLKERGYRHYIFISPMRDQVTGGAPQDALVLDLLHKYALDPFYLADEIERFNLTGEQKEALYHDFIHLDKEGHKLWAKIIAARLSQELKSGA